MDEQEYRERLARDIASWRRDGILDADAEAALLARVGVEPAAATRVLRLGWFASVVSIIGAIVLAAGIVLLFGANWQDLATWFRSGALIAGMIVAYAAGYVLMERYGMQRIGSALLLLGALLFEAAVFLLAQIYNMPVDSPELWLLAAVGTFPLAYLFGSRIILLLAIANVIAYTVSKLMSVYGDSPKSEIALLVVAMLGVVLYSTGRLHALYGLLEHFAETYVLAGLLVLLGLIYAFSFDEPWSSMIENGVRSFSAPPVAYVSMAVALAVVAAQFALRPRSLESTIESGGQVMIVAIAAIVATWPGWTGYAVIFNAVYFAIALGLVLRGYLFQDERYINIGLAAVALGLATRYIDVFWSMLATSAFFIIGGVLLLAVAFALEWTRRGLVRGMIAGRSGPAGGVA
jgi:uncharacterized membrane protein